MEKQGRTLVTCPQNFG